MREPTSTPTARLEAQETALEHRTRSLGLAGPLALFFSLLALALGAGVFIVFRTAT